MDYGPIPVGDFQRFLYNCERKTPMSRQHAMLQAQRFQSRTPWVTAYKCVVAHGDHWHVGGTIAMRDLTLLARWMRFGAE